LTNEKLGDDDWKEWQDILLNAFKHRLATIDSKGYQVVQARKTIVALFLQLKGFNVPSADILREAIRTIRKREVKVCRYDKIAMMGHRIGIVDSIASLNLYLQDAHKLLTPDGQVLFTSLGVNTAIQQEQKSYEKQNIRYVSDMQFQQENLIGPFFSLLRIKFESLKSQVAMTTWQCEVTHWQDNDNYLIRLF